MSEKYNACNVVRFLALPVEVTMLLLLLLLLLLPNHVGAASPSVLVAAAEITGTASSDDMRLEFHATLLRQPGVSRRNVHSSQSTQFYSCCSSVHL